jgi:putative acetyltransferase
VQLYRAVARTPGGLARLEHEIDPGYVQGFLDKALSSGESFVAVTTDGALVGEIHAALPGPFCFSHVLSDLTIAVHPDAQGLGVGRRLFETLMATVRRNRPEILRVELVARQSNERAIAFYESLGFEREGTMRRRIRNLDGTFEPDIPMAWLRETDR